MRYLFCFYLIGILGLNSINAQKARGQVDLLDIRLGLESPMPILGIRSPLVCLGVGLGLTPQQQVLLYGGFGPMWQQEYVFKSFLELDYKIHFGTLIAKSARRVGFIKLGLGSLMQHPYVFIGDQVDYVTPYFNFGMGVDIPLHKNLGISIELGMNIRFATLAFWNEDNRLVVKDMSLYYGGLGNNSYYSNTGAGYYYNNATVPGHHIVFTMNTLALWPFFRLNIYFRVPSK